MTDHDKHLHDGIDRRDSHEGGTVNASLDAIWDAYMLEDTAKAQQDEWDFLANVAGYVGDLVFDAECPSVSRIISSIRDGRKEWKAEKHRIAKQLKEDAESGEPTLAYLLKL